MQKFKLSTGWDWLARLVRHYRVAGKFGTFVCARGLTNKCVIRGIIYDSSWQSELAYRIDYMPADSDMWVNNAEIPINIFQPNAESRSGEKEARP